MKLARPSIGRYSCVTTRKYLIKLLVGEDLLLDLLDDGEDVGLSGIVTVGTDTEINLLRVGVIAIGNSRTQNGIGRSHLHMPKEILLPGDVLLLQTQSQTLQSLHRRMTQLINFQLVTANRLIVK